MKSPLKYLGGKSWLVPLVKQLFDQGKYSYIDPTCGSCKIPLALGLKVAVLSDASYPLINFWTWAKKGFLAEGQYLCPLDHNVETYKNNRDKFNRLGWHSDAQESAHLYYYLNRHGYNGLMRFNQRGKYNVPMGRYKKVFHFSSEDWAELKQDLQDWSFSCSDFADTRKQELPFLFIDPPYHETFTQYTPGDFKDIAQERVWEWVLSHPGPGFICNSGTPFIKDLYGDHIVHEEKRHDTMGKGRHGLVEVLAANAVGKELWAEVSP